MPNVQTQDHCYGRSTYKQWLRLSKAVSSIQIRLWHMACRAAGEDPLPEEDPVQFKPIPEPNPLDSYLLLNQVANLCDQLGAQSTQTLQKLYTLEGFQQRAS